MSAWKQLHMCFDTDDGALHDIRLTALSERGLIAGFAFVRSHSLVTPDALFWHTGLERDLRVADYPDVAELVARGVAEPFHVLASALRFRGAVIPDLGVFVWPDEITFDYRAGPEWTEPQLLALFELLRQIVAEAGGQVSLGKHVLPKVNRLFVEEWETYCDNATPTNT